MGDGVAGPAGAAERGGSALLETHDLDEAREAAGAAYYPHRLTALRGADHLHARIHTARLGPLTLGVLSYNADVRLDCGELAHGYEINIPVSGHVESECGGREVLSTPHRAAVYTPTGHTTIKRWSADCRQYGVKVSRDHLEGALERLLGRSVSSPIRLAPSLDVGGGAGSTWFELVRRVTDQARGDAELLHHPLVAEQLGEAITTGLLLTVGHEHLDELTAPRPPARPPAVSRALAAMEAEPDRAWSVADLAAAAGCSVRSLQAGFAEHLGAPPMRHLRQVRLRRAHQDLGASDPATATVAGIAHRWGFTHLGRFAAAYRRTYGVAPSTTLRHGAG